MAARQGGAESVSDVLRDDCVDRFAEVDLQTLMSRQLELAGVQSQLVQDRGMNIGDVVAILHSVETTRRVRDGRFVGRNGEPIRNALSQLPSDGGTVVIEPGTYLIRQPIKPPSRATIRGADALRTVLRLPQPSVITEAVEKGSRRVPVADAGAFVAGTTVELLPPDGNRFEQLETRSLERRIESVQNNRLELSAPVPLELPKGSRIGYAHHVVAIGGAVESVTIEGLTIEGGRREDLSMPGHAKRCAVWAVSPYTYAGGPKKPPVSKLLVRHCNIRNCYGRAVAMYNAVDSQVVGCRIAGIDDEAIDFDHFTARCRAEGNVVQGAKVGVTLNDATDCTVRHNRLVRCGSGVRLWWWYKVDPKGVNQGNVIEHNTIEAPDRAAIYLGEKAVNNTVRYNFVEGPVEEAAKEKNTVSLNTRVPAEQTDKR